MADKRDSETADSMTSDIVGDTGRTTRPPYIIPPVEPKVEKRIRYFTLLLYTLFSMLPVFLIVISIAAFSMGKHASVPPVATNAWSYKVLAQAPVGEEPDRKGARDIVIGDGVYRVTGLEPGKSELVGIYVDGNGTPIPVACVTAVTLPFAVPIGNSTRLCDELVNVTVAHLAP